jgi:hypothetical protein
VNIPEWLKIDIGRMLSEGISEAGIRCVVEAMKEVPTDFGDLHYAAFVEYGVREDDNVVEGTVVYPATDEQRLLPEGKP